MSSKKFNDIFNNHFFDGLLKEDVESLNIELFVEKTYEPGQMLIEQDTFGDFMFLIASGEVIISKVIGTSNIELARRRDGEYVGEMALFDGQLRSANVVASTNVTGYIIDANLFFYLFRNFEQVKLNIIKIINRTVRDTGSKFGHTSVTHNKQLSRKETELVEIRCLLDETIELKRSIDEQKCELELINRELEKRNQELYQLSIKDDLTHLYSKTHFLSLLESEFSRSRKYKIDFSVIVIDMDDFSNINKRFGNFTGDRILKEIAGIILTIVRDEDVVGRISGDRFSIILPHQDIKEAEIIGETILSKIEENVLLLDGVKQVLTVSIGISDNSIEGITNGKEILLNASQAMDRSKSNGKNRIELFKPLSRSSL